VATATGRELFDFVTDPTIGTHNIEACLDRLIAVADERAASGVKCGAAKAACLAPQSCVRLR
jgi:hypothetical protein